MEDFRETCEDFMGWLAQLATRRGKKMLFMGVEVTLDPKQRRTEDYGMVQSIRTQFAEVDAQTTMAKQKLQKTIKQERDRPVIMQRTFVSIESTPCSHGLDFYSRAYCFANPPMTGFTCAT